MENVQLLVTRAQLYVQEWWTSQGRVAVGQALLALQAPPHLTPEQVVAFALMFAFSFTVTYSLCLSILTYWVDRKKGAKKTGEEGEEEEEELTAPPMIPYSLPFVGSAIEYGMEPIQFLLKAKEKYGSCFSFLMMGRKMTFCLGPDGNHFVFNVPLAKASAEGAYQKLTMPVFGKGVIYDVENSVLMDQKRFVKDALTTTAFRSYVPMIMEEVRDYFKTWKELDPAFEIFPTMAELTIRTASRCLMGKEIRAQLHSGVAKMFHDLDAGLAPINVFFQNLPLPSYWNRDRANRDMSALFLSIIKKRRETGDMSNMDVLQTLMTSSYKNGKKMTDQECAHMMIALLMAGQHTSSTTLAWTIFEIARSRELIQQLLEEQSNVLTGKPDTPVAELPDFDYDDLKSFTTLDTVIKEALRLHSPIHTVMRRVEADLQYKNFLIPKGHFLCGSPSVSQLDTERFEDPYTFDPSRHVNSDEGAGEWTINGVDIAQKSARSHFLPFGAGRHRCIGEAFAFVQIKSIISLFLRSFEFDLVRDPAKPDAPPHFPRTDFTSLIVMPAKGSCISYARREGIPV